MASCSLVGLKIKETDQLIYHVSYRPHPGLYSYRLGIMSINQDVGQDVLSEIQRSPFSIEWLQIG